MRVERWFGFVDLSGFTAFTDAEGDDQSVVVLTEFRSVIREVASEHGVRVAKWLGDGAMFVCTEPAPLVCAMVQLEDRVLSAGLTLPVRGGASGGLVILFEGDDYIGYPVNLAARLCDAAAPGELLLDAALRDHLPNGVEAEPAGEWDLPGFRARVPVVRVRAAARTHEHEEA